MLLPLMTALAACSPTLDWREVRVEPTGLNAVWPCKPDREARQVGPDVADPFFAGLRFE